MSKQQRVMQLVREVGDLRENIGAARARLESLQSLLTLRESELESALAPDAIAPTATVKTAAATIPPMPVPPPKLRTLLGDGRRRLRNGSIPARILALLGEHPEQTFSVTEIAKKLGVGARPLYGPLSRLSESSRIVRVSDGVFRAATNSAGGLKIAAER